MPHYTPLIGTIVVGLVAAFIMGAIAHRLRVSPLAGYLFAGVIVGPFTPGFVADAALANELAELGVILLMFGVGLHFSLRDLLSVKNIAVPGAIVQITVATLLGMGLGLWLGWPIAGGLVFGLALSVASTVVLLRALQARDLINTERGRIAVGWLIVEDLAMVLALVLLPPLAEMLQGNATGGSGVAMTFGVTLLKVCGFIAFMLIVGRRVIPWALHWVAHTGSRELFRLSVLAIALGVAFGAAFVFDVSFALGAFFAGMILGETQLSRRAAEETLPLRDAFAVLFFVSVGMLFDPAVVVEQPLPLLATVVIIVSFALGAFFAGMILCETQLSRRAAEETLPLRDAFAVLFFVSVGMLFDPAVVVEQPLPLLATVVIIVLGKSIAAFGIVRAFGHPSGTALTISASLAQIGEFSFILAGLGVGLGILPDEGRDLILAGAIISIFLNPFIFTAIAGRVAQSRKITEAEADAIERQRELDRREHAILVGYGRVGQLVAAGTDRALVIVEDQPDMARQAEEDGFQVLLGNASDPYVLKEAGIKEAAKLVIAIPEGFEAGAIAENARRLNPDLTIFARAHSDDEVKHLEKLGADEVVMGEREIAKRLLHLMVLKRPVKTT